MRRLLFQNCTQRSPVDPLHDHIQSAAVFAVKGFHDAWMVKMQANLLLTLETLQEDGVGLHLDVGNLQEYLLSVTQVS